MNADRMVYRIYELRESLGAAKSPRLFDAIGTQWSEVCARPGCGSRRHHSAWSPQLRESIERCVRCGTLWSGEAIQVPKGSIQGLGRGAGFDDGFAELGHYVSILQRVPDVERTLYLLYLDPAGSGRDGGRSRAAARATEAGLFGAQGVSEWDVRTAVTRARQIIEGYLNAGEEE
jgi:hypothetical protein